MKPILITCPVTNMRVQHLVVDPAAAVKDPVFELFKCPACGRLHLIDGAGKLATDKPAG